MGQNLASAAFPSVAQQQQQQPDDVPWLLRYLARGVGTVGALLCIILGVWTCISFSAFCIVAGIFQVLTGFIVMIVEAPCCCLFIDNVQKLSSWADTKPYWQKGVFYLILALPPFIMCWALSTFFGSGLIFATAVLYGMMALGKKAPRDVMITRAQSGEMQANQEMKVNLMSDQAHTMSSEIPEPHSI